MKAYIAVLIVLVGILGCTSLGESKREKQAFVEQQAWLEMCQLLIDEKVGYACNRLMLPLVVYEIMREGLNGYYKGGDTIYINSKLQGTALFDVLMHEGIHYVHFQHGIIRVPGPAPEICWSENEAWTLTGIYWNEDNSKWWRAYPHCWEYYANTEELRELGAIYNWINAVIDGIIFETPEEPTDENSTQDVSITRSYD